MEKTTQMTTGVSMPVNTGEMETVNTPVILSGSEESHDAVEQPREDAEYADLLLQSAKEEGFEEALVRLANDDLERIEKVDRDDPEDGLDVENDQPDADTDGPIDFEKEMLRERIAELEPKVGDLMDETTDLLERVRTAEGSAQMTTEAMVMMLKVLYEMMKKEEDEKAKVNLLELMILFVGKFMQSVIDPEKQQNIQPQNTEVRPSQKSRLSTEKLGELLKMLQKKGKPEPELPLAA